MKIMPGERKSNYLAGFGVFLTMAVLIIGITGCGGCDQPPSQSLEIRTWYDLDAVRDNLSGNHKLMNDLDCTTDGYEELASPTANAGKGWEPIGMNTQGGCGRFVGTLDGHGYEIRDMSINRPERQDVGLFGVVGRKGVVGNIGALNVTVTGRLYVGGLVGSIYEGTVRDSYSTGSVIGNEYGVGGLVGYNGGTVSNCYAMGSVIGNCGVGGLVGSNYKGTVGDSYSTGSVAGNDHVGGLVGENGGTVLDSFWDMQTSGQATSAGGVGKTTAEMRNIPTFRDAGWSIIAVGLNETDSACIWNIVDGETCPFLSWRSTI